jgi:hypothetical protein
LQQAHVILISDLAVYTLSFRNRIPPTVAAWKKPTDSVGWKQLEPSKTPEICTPLPAWALKENGNAPVPNGQVHFTPWRSA